MIFEMQLNFFSMITFTDNVHHFSLRESFFTKIKLNSTICNMALAQKKYLFDINRKINLSLFSIYFMTNGTPPPTKKKIHQTSTGFREETENVQILINAQ